MRNKERRFILETSIQIKKGIDSDVKEKLKEFEVQGKFYSTNFILYEYKCALIRELINFYFHVKTGGDLANVFSRWTDTFKIRKLKHTGTLTAYFAALGRNIDFGNVESFLAELEGVICWLVSQFMFKLKGLVGSFGSDEIVRYEIRDSSTYQKFLDLYKNRGEIIPLEVFWKGNQRKIGKLVALKEQISKAKLNSIYDALVAVEADLEKLKQIRINHNLGDAIIAVDTPEGYVIVTVDKSFETLCGILEKESIRVEKTSTETQDLSVIANKEQEL